MKQLFGKTLTDQFVDVVSQGSKVACFGSRGTPDEVLTLMFYLGRYIAKSGGVCSSGHAMGADKAFEYGACSVDSSSMEINLPWPSYNSDIHIAEGATIQVLSDLEDENEIINRASQYHSAWSRVRGRRIIERLHARNILIVEGASFGIGYLNHEKPGCGGSGLSYRYLKANRVPVIDLADTETFDTWSEFILERNNMGDTTKEIVENVRRNRDLSKAPAEVRGDSVASVDVYTEGDDSSESDSD